jgi:serine phosphatase RsbU (regulator of sigma subunit)
LRIPPFGKYSHSHIGLGLLLSTGLVLAVALCVQCVRTYIYIGAVLVPQEAEREAERQSGALAAAARTAGVTEPAALGPLMERAVEPSANVIWMRLLDPANAVLAEAGRAPAAAIPRGWWQRVERHESLGQVVPTAGGKVLVAFLPFRMPRPFRGAPPEPPSALEPHNHEPHNHPPRGRPPGAYVLGIAVSLDSAAAAFDGLRRNVMFGLFAAAALLLSVAVIGMRTPNYLRGKYLERELQLARSVQKDLQPKARPVSPFIDFAASSLAADQVGGDFHDVFETSTGRIIIVLGDVSGKGVPAALLASVLHGAIRSSSGSQHDAACERINRMLCERTASERYVTLFWAVFDPHSSTLRYVNAGHPAPMFIRGDRTERLQEGGPVLGILPSATYSAGVVQVEAGDTLIAYSDGISEATNLGGEEFGEKGIAEVASAAAAELPAEICRRMMSQVSAHARGGGAPDDRSLIVARFSRSAAAMSA